MLYAYAFTFEIIDTFLPWCNCVYYVQDQDIYGVLFSIGKNHRSFSANIAKHLAKEVFLHCLLSIVFVC